MRKNENENECEKNASACVRPQKTNAVVLLVALVVASRHNVGAYHASASSININTAQPHQRCRAWTVSAFGR
jgi:hypothetical protein